MVARLKMEFLSRTNNLFNQLYRAIPLNGYQLIILQCIATSNLTNNAQQNRHFDYCTGYCTVGYFAS